MDGFSVATCRLKVGQALYCSTSQGGVGQGYAEMLIRIRGARQGEGSCGSDGRAEACACAFVVAFSSLILLYSLVVPLDWFSWLPVLTTIMHYFIAQLLGACDLGSFPILFCPIMQSFSPTEAGLWYLTRKFPAKQIFMYVRISSPLYPMLMSVNDCTMSGYPQT